MTARPGDDFASDNRRTWDAWSDGYQQKHGWLLRDPAEAWGLWRRPERDLRVLDSVAGRNVLELGCGAAHWADSLTRRGAWVVGLDISIRQLRHAPRRNNSSDRSATVLQADAHVLPFPGVSFDLVLSDYGGMTWADPYVTVPEIARVLRPGGQLAFCTNSPFFAMCWDFKARALTPQLCRAYFGLYRRQAAPNAVDFVLGYGEWVTLLGSYGLAVERLIEEPPSANATTTFRDRPAEWTSRWPIETIWSARKRF